jgi:ABC-type hemin transport system substrate-binding protein
VTRRRVVSLVPSVTETLRALGVAPVACTRFCEQPDLPAVGGTKDPDVAAIVSLAPDLVVMNDEENRREDFAALRSSGLEVVDVSPRTLADVGDVVVRLARLVDHPVPALFEDWAAWLAVHAASAPTRSAVTLVWRRPWMALGVDTYGAALLAAVGFTTPALTGADGAGAARYPEVTLDAVCAREPAAVLLPSEPYPFAERHRAEVATAVPHAEVALVDGQDLFWWGTRTPAALTRLAAQLG